MVVLHIEHPVTDFTAWRSAFDRFAEARRNAGVRGCRILRPVDEAYVVIELEFGLPEEAERFLRFLETQVWPNASVLRGEPQTRILEQVETAAV